jgi:hypothetical protein
MARECCHLAEAGRDKRVLGVTCRRALKRRDAQGFIVKRDKVRRNEGEKRENVRWRKRMREIGSRRRDLRDVL